MAHLVISLLLPCLILYLGIRKNVVVEAVSCPSSSSHYRFTSGRCSCMDIIDSSENCHGEISSVERGSLLFLSCRGIEELVEEKNLTEFVGCLYIEDSPLITTLDRDSMAIFPRLTGLHIVNSGLETISQDAFDAHSSLYYLSLSGNKITQVPRLDNLTCLLGLDMNDNRISSLPSDLFKNNPGVRRIDLEGNLLTEVTGSVFANKCYLNEVDLSHNSELRVVESSVFEESPITILDMAFTKISRVPVTDSLRRNLEQLNLTNVFELKEFNAFMSGSEFYNQTFPRLGEAHLTYHAHCCQLKLGPHYQYDIPSFARAARSLFHRIGSYVFESKRFTRQLSDSSTYTCINMTSQQIECINDIDMASLNIFNSGLINITSREEFCNTSLACLQCAQSLCQRNCTSMNTSSVVLSNTSVLCVAPDQHVQSTTVMITPTQSSSYSTLLPTPTVATTSNEPMLASFPSCLNQSLVTTIARVNTTCVMPQPTPSSTPSPLGPCDPDFCESMPLGSFCEECKSSMCNPSTSSISCDTFADNIPGFCTCASKKRSVISKRAVQDTCLTEKKVACANCSTVSTLPSGWFRIENNFQLACMEVNESSTESPPTESPCFTSQTCRVTPINGFVPSKLTTCLPMENAFNPCTNLLNDDNYLRVAIWFVISLGFVGNGLVILVFIIYTCFKRRLKVDYFIIHFFYFNLALADFLMCLYLMTIASEDLSTLNEFSRHDVLWRTGPGCKFAGFVAILSTVVSVYVLTVITLERGYTIINAMHRKKVNKKVAFFLMGLGWALGFLLAILPVSGEVNDYSSVAICLPFRVSNDVDVSYIVFLILATGVAFLVIAVTYIIIFGHIFCRQSLSRVSGSRRKTEIKVAIRMFVLVVTNFVCWFPIALASLASVFGPGIVPDITFAKWAIVFILPINSCLNPILYSISTKIFRENLIIVLSKMRLCQSNAQRIARERAGLTPSGTSQPSSTDPRRRRPTIIERLRLLSISSQGSSNRRDSTLSQLSDSERYHFALLHSRRKSSILSDSSKDDGRTPSCPVSSGIDESLSTGVSIQNMNFRSSSPNVAARRASAKISGSSLGTLPEESELVMPDRADNIVKVNPAYIEEEGADYTDTIVQTNLVQNKLIVSHSEASLCPQHQLHASENHDSNFSEENDSGHSENFSGSPSVNSESEHQTESIQKEIDFD